MKKLLVLSVAALVLITLSGCQFNLFAVFDRIEIPSATELNSRAGSDPDGFVSDVEEYIETGSITEDNADDVVAALAIVYGSASGDTKQKAAVLAGEIQITSNSVTSSVVNGVIGAIATAQADNTDLDPEKLIKGIFPDDLNIQTLGVILDDLAAAADAYAVFAASVNSGPADWMSDSEVMDVAFYAIVSLAVTDIRDQVGDQALLDAINDGDTLVGVNDPFDSSNTTLHDEAIKDILIFAGFENLGS